MSRFSIEAVVSMIDRVSGPMKGAANSAAGFSKKVQGHFGAAEVASSKFSGALRNGLSTLGVIGGFAAVAAGFKKIVSSAMELEDAQAAFTPLLGGTAKAIEMVDKLNILGAETPFQFQDLASVTKQLLPVMNGDIDNTIRTIRLLGDTAGGNAQKLDSITRGYTKAMLKGKVDMESLNMIAEAGVPIHTELARSMGYGKDRMGEFFKRVSAGKVTTDELNKAFVKMTGEGGIFFQGMIISSKTTSGVMSTMSDALTMTAAAVGTQLLPTIKELAMSVTSSATAVLKFTQDHKEGIGTVIKIIWALRWALFAIIPLWIMYKIYLAGVAVAKMFLAIKTGILTAVEWAQSLASDASALSMMGESTAATVASGSKWKLTAATIKNKIVTAASTVAQWAMTAATWAWNAAGVIAAGVTWAFGAAVAFLTSPITLVVLAIVALIAIGVLLYKNWDVVKEKMTAAWNYIKEGVFSLGRGIMTAILNPVNLVMFAIVSLLDAASAIPGIGDKFAGAADTIRGFQNSMNEATGATNMVNVVQNAVTGGATIPAGATPGAATPAGGGAGITGAYASPNSAGMVAGTHSTTTGNLNINVTTPKDAATVERSGTMPQALKLNLGYAQ